MAKYDVQLEDIKVWTDRWAAYQFALDKLETFVGGSTDISRKNTLSPMINLLRVFAENHFNFFKECILVGNEDYLFMKDDYDPNYVMRMALHNIVEDINLLSEVVRQRTIVEHNDLQRDTLAQADRLAWSALQPARGLLKQPDPENNKPEKPYTVLTYFEKRPTARIVPYANVALIGIPNSTLMSKVDFLAIPHEVGHFLYHKMSNVRFNNMVLDLNAYIKQETGKGKDIKWLKYWFEEIFSDVYGTIVAGAPIALSFQDLALGAQDWFKDDGEHPIPYLRPLIYEQVMQHPSIASNKLINATDELKNRRHNKREFGEKLAGREFTHHKNRKSALLEVKGFVDKIIDLLFTDNLTQYRKDASLPGVFHGIRVPYWDIAIANVQTADEYYTKFSDFVGGFSLSFDEEQKFIKSCNVTNTYKVDWETWVGVDKNRKGEIMEETGPRPNPDRLKKRINQNVWIPILEAGTWSTEGPGTRENTGD